MPKSPIKSEKHSLLIVVSLILVLAAAAMYVYINTPNIESTQVAHTQSQS